MGIFMDYFLIQSRDDSSALAWMIDEVAKYNGKYIEVNSFENIINTIRTSGHWTDSGGGVSLREILVVMITSV